MVGDAGMVECSLFHILAGKRGFCELEYVLIILLGCS